MAKSTDIDLVKNAAEFCGYEYVVMEDLFGKKAVFLTTDGVLGNIFLPLTDRNDLEKVEVKLLSLRWQIAIWKDFTNIWFSLDKQGFRFGFYPDEFPRAVLELVWEITHKEG